MKRVLVLWVVLIEIVIASVVQAQDNLIVNGNFDTPEFFGVSLTILTPPFGFGWTVDSNFVDLINSLWAGTGGTSNPDGIDQSIHLRSGGSISQTFNTEIGRTYSIEFSYSHHVDTNSATGSLTVIGNNIHISENILHNTPNSSLDMQWQIFSRTFVADSEITTLSVSDTTASAIHGLTVDNVHVSIIDLPQPPPQLTRVFEFILDRGIINIEFTGKDIDGDDFIIKPISGISSDELEFLRVQWTPTELTNVDSFTIDPAFQVYFQYQVSTNTIVQVVASHQINFAPRIQKGHLAATVWDADGDQLFSDILSTNDITETPPPPPPTGNMPFTLDFEDNALPSSHDWHMMLQDNGTHTIVNGNASAGGTKVLRMNGEDQFGWFLNLEGVVDLNADWAFSADTRRIAGGGAHTDQGIERFGAGNGGSGFAIRLNDGDWNNILLVMDHANNEVRTYVNGSHVETNEPVDDLSPFVNSSNAIWFGFGNVGVSATAEFDNIIFVARGIDSDNDDLEDVDELILGTDFNDPDTDGDGVNDGDDAFPLNSAESQDSDGDGLGDNSDNCPTTPNPDQTDVNNDGFGDACVDPSVNIPASATIGANPTIGAETVINKGVTIGDNAVIGANVTLNKDVTAGDNLMVGDGSTINKDSTLGDDVVLGANVTLNKDCIIGNNVTIGDNTVIGQSCIIGNDVTIGVNVSIGKDVTVLTGTMIPDGTVIPKGVTVPPLP